METHEAEVGKRWGSHQPVRFESERKACRGINSHPTPPKKIDINNSNFHNLLNNPMFSKVLEITWIIVFSYAQLKRLDYFCIIKKLMSEKLRLFMSPFCQNKEKQREVREAKVPRDSSKNSTAFPLSQSMTGRTSKTCNLLIEKATNASEHELVIYLTKKHMAEKK